MLKQSQANELINADRMISVTQAMERVIPSSPEIRQQWLGLVSRAKELALQEQDEAERKHISEDDTFS